MRPDIPKLNKEALPKDLIALIEACWMEIPENRPSSAAARRAVFESTKMLYVYLLCMIGSIRTYCTSVLRQER